jgi:hypothetical protein
METSERPRLSTAGHLWRISLRGLETTGEEVKAKSEWYCFVLGLIIFASRRRRKMGVKVSAKSGTPKAPISPLRRRSQLMDSQKGSSQSFFADSQEEPSLSAESNEDTLRGAGGKLLGNSNELLARVKARKAARAQRATTEDQ